MLYTLDLYNVICQLYLNKAGGKKPSITRRDRNKSDKGDILLLINLTDIY